MSNIIEGIFSRKINEIQARLPVKIVQNDPSKPTLTKDSPQNFTEVLEQKTASLNGTSTVNDKKNITKNTGVAPKVNYSSLKPVSIDKSSYNTIIDEISAKYNMDNKLISSVIKAESSFNPNSVSSAGAIGLMQLMPATAAGLSVKNPFDPYQNVDGGTRYLKQLLNRYNGDVKIALAAYNCGPGTINRLNVTNLDDPTQMAKLPLETRNYVKKIMGYLV